MPSSDLKSTVLLTKKKTGAFVFTFDDIVPVINDLRYLADTTGGISGSGTIGYLPYWSAVTTLADSGVYYDGSAIALGTTTINSSALFQMDSTTKGLLAPRMTTAQRNAISSPSTGLLIYNTSNSLFNYYDGSSWINVDSGTDDFTNGGNAFGGNAILGLTDNFRLDFKTNNVVRMGIQNSGEVAIGATPVSGVRFFVQGSGSTLSTYTAQFHNSTGTSNSLILREDGFAGINVLAPVVGEKVSIGGSTLIASGGTQVLISNGSGYGQILGYGNSLQLGSDLANDIITITRADSHVNFRGNVVIGNTSATPNAVLDVRYESAGAGTAVYVYNGNTSKVLFAVKNTAVIYTPNRQTGSAGLASGEEYVDTAANILANGDKIVAWKV